MQGRASSVETTAVSLDYLTLTYRERNVRLLVEDSCKSQLYAREREGEVLRSWQGLGYTGVGSRGISWGTREDTDIVRASGMWAEHMFDVLRSYKGHCSRIDLQVTVDLVKPKRSVASHFYNRLTVMQELAEAKNCSLIVNSQGGETLYIGSRKSDKFARLYDKGVESLTKPPGHQYRYEVEYKGDAAPIVYERLTASNDRCSIIAATVQRFFRERGVPVPWDSAHDPISTYVHRHPSSVESSLHWLTHQVRGTVVRLKNMGLDGEVLEALGLKGE